MSLFLLLINLLTVYLPTIIIGLALPMFTKKTLFFGVSIPEDQFNHEGLQKLKKLYYRNYGFSSIGTTAFIFYAFYRYKIESILLAGIFAIVFLLSLNYYYIHRSAKIIKHREGWFVDKKQVVVVETKKRFNEKAISPKWFAVPFGILLFGVLFTMIQYPHLPNKIPVHFNLQGEVTGYEEKSLGTLFKLPIIQFGFTIMMFWLYKMVGQVKSTINPAKPKVSLMQIQIANRRWGIFMVLFASLLNIQFLYTQFLMLQMIDPSSQMLVTILMTVAFITLIVVISFMTGQSGSRVSIPEDEEANPKLIQRDDDSLWKLGMFYYNPEDPTLWVEKRFGVGWTINHGHPIGKVLTIGIIMMLAVLLGKTIMNRL